MVALSEDARLDRLERHVSAIWQSLHSISATLQQHVQFDIRREMEFSACCDELIAALQLLKDELDGMGS